MFRILLPIVCIIGSINSKKLLTTIVIHRHGDRSQLTTYRTDPYGHESHWPDGLGQLTKRGMLRQYELGVFLRDRYSDFLPKKYSEKNLKVVSTDADRTLMSAQLTLSGLYFPESSEKFHPDINWVPIPVHTTPRKQDPVLAMKKPCKKYESMLRDLFNSTQIAQFDKDNQDLYRFLQEKTGNTIQNVHDVEIIHNALHSQFLANKTLPDWANKVYPYKLKEATILRYQLPCYTPQLARLKTGLLLGEIITHFNNYVRNGKQVPKMLLFSAHDSTLSDLMTSIGVFNAAIPTYSSAILMELHKEKDAYVNIHFKNVTGFYDFVLPNCSFQCNFESFVKILKPIVITNVKDWEKECEN